MSALFGTLYLLPNYCFAQIVSMLNQNHPVSLQKATCSLKQSKYKHLSVAVYDLPFCFTKQSLFISSH